MCPFKDPGTQSAHLNIRYTEACCSIKWTSMDRHKKTGRTWFCKLCKLMFLMNCHTVAYATHFQEKLVCEILQMRRGIKGYLPESTMFCTKKTTWMTNKMQSLLTGKYLESINIVEMCRLFYLPRPWGLRRCLSLWWRPLLIHSSSPEPARPSESRCPAYRLRTLEKAGERKNTQEISWNYSFISKHSALATSYAKRTQRDTVRDKMLHTRVTRWLVEITKRSIKGPYHKKSPQG